MHIQKVLIPVNTTLQRLAEISNAVRDKYPEFREFVWRIIHGNVHGNYEDFRNDPELIARMKEMKLVLPEAHPASRLTLDVKTILGIKTIDPTANRYPFTRLIPGNKQTRNNFQNFLSDVKALTEQAKWWLVQLAENEREDGVTTVSEKEFRTEASPAIDELKGKRLLTELSSTAAWGTLYRIDWTSVSKLESRPPFIIEFEDGTQQLVE